MRVVSMFPVLLLAACAGGDATTSASGGSPTPFDGRYDGTSEGLRTGCATSIAPARVSMSVVNGRATVPLPGDRRVTADVMPDGSLQRITLVGPALSGTFFGTGRISDKKFTIHLHTQGPNQRTTCGYRYEGERAT